MTTQTQTKPTCEWGSCDGQASETVRYPDGSTLRVCPDCAGVARAEAEHLSHD